MNSKRLMQVNRVIIGDKTRVIVSNKIDKKDALYEFYTDLEYKNQYLSDENLSYYVSFCDVVENEEETDKDQYLLHHALQENKKLCVSFRTHNSAEILNVFKDDRYVCSEPRNVKNDNRKDITVVRTGTLSDYYNINEILQWYIDNCRAYIDRELIRDMAAQQLSEIAFGKYIYRGVKYNYVMYFGGDEVLHTYGPAALVISGLLLGYPLESTKSVIESIFGAFI